MCCWVNGLICSRVVIGGGGMFEGRYWGGGESQTAGDFAILGSV